MTRKEFVEKVKEIQRVKTAYCRGAFGAPLNQKNKDRYKYGGEVDPKRFAFDCCGLWHAAASGWNGDSAATYGGTKVNKEVNGISYGDYRIPDNGADGAFKSYLKDVSNDMTKVQDGEILWVPGHNGVCVDAAKGYAVECTPKWEDGVQISQWKDPKAPHYREWLQHGKLPFIIYADTDSVVVQPKKKTLTCPCCGATFELKEG